MSVKYYAVYYNETDNATYYLSKELGRFSLEFEAALTKNPNAAVIGDIREIGRVLSRFDEGRTKGVWELKLAKEVSCQATKWVVG